MNWSRASFRLRSVISQTSNCTPRCTSCSTRSSYLLPLRSEAPFIMKSTPSACATTTILACGFTSRWLPMLRRPLLACAVPSLRWYTTRSGPWSGPPPLPAQPDSRETAAAAASAAAKSRRFNSAPAAACGGHRGIRIAPAGPGDLAAFQLRRHRDLDRVLLVPAADRAVRLDDPFVFPVLGIGLARDLDARAGTLELARLFRRRRHLLLGRLGSGNQGLGRFLGFAPRHLRQDERDRDESN